MQMDADTEQLKLSNSQERVKCFIPMNKVGKPIDVAKMVYFLASDKYISGAVIRIDGGLGGDDG